MDGNTNRRIVFPDFARSESTSGSIVYTRVRKKHRGKWYLVLIIVGGDGDSSMKRLFKEVYLFMLFGKIQSELKTIQGIRLYEKDEIQISEEERMNTWK